MIVMIVPLPLTIMKYTQYARKQSEENHCVLTFQESKMREKKTSIDVMFSIVMSLARLTQKENSKNKEMKKGMPLRNEW